MIGNIGKFILFLLSYTPLLAFIIYHNLDNGEVLIICLLIFIMLLGLSYWITKRVRKYNSQNVVFESIKNPSKEAITLHTVIYILPFATMNFHASTENVPNFLILGTVLLVLGYSFIKYKLIHVNPILALFLRYSIYEVTIDGKPIYLLSKRSLSSIKISESLDILQMADLLYIERDH